MIIKCRDCGARSDESPDDPAPALCPSCYKARLERVRTGFEALAETTDDPAKLAAWFENALIEIGGELPEFAREHARTMIQQASAETYGPFVFAENPNYAGQQPQPLQPSCHDGSPSMDTLCGKCGFTMHVHESQLAKVPPGYGVAAQCKRCNHIMQYPPGYLAAGFAEMRKRGWIA